MMLASAMRVRSAARVSSFTRVLSMASKVPASVVVNNHNYARFLSDAIDSALSQTHPDTEVIVVDDGSTDGSPEVISGYGDNITAILNEWGGQGSAVNAGFAASSGEL